MDLEQFKAIVTKFGEDHILGFIFDNSDKRLFREGEFTLEKFLDEKIESLIFSVEDTREIEYNVIKPIETIQTILTVNNVSDMNKIDRRYLLN